VGINKMSYNKVENEIWTIENGDWISSKYLDKQDLLRKIRRRNLIFIGSFVAYLVISVAFIFF
jgi:hypothetical protein